MLGDLYPARPDTRRGILSPSDREQLAAVAASAPPLSAEQRARLRPLLAGTLTSTPAPAADRAA
jgi:hypothetical protein